MFKIGEFSKLAMVTVKTLRFYDVEGLLKPDRVDEFSGYRYYTALQLYDLRKIVALRQAGLSIPEIKAVMSGNNVAEILESRKKTLEAERDEANERCLRITKIIDTLKEGYSMKFQATVKTIPCRNIFYGVKKLHCFDDLNEFICGLGEECRKLKPSVKCAYPEYCYVSYLDKEFTDTDFTAMYAQAVETKGVDSENVKFSVAPEAEIVSVIVKGGYTENLPDAYAFVMQWIEDNGFSVADRPREVYIDGVWNKPDPVDYLTEIQVPVEKKN